MSELKVVWGDDNTGTVEVPYERFEAWLETLAFEAAGEGHPFIHLTMNLLLQGIGEIEMNWSSPPNFTLVVKKVQL